MDNRALVVIDLQRGFLTGNEPFLDRLQGLLDKKKFANIVFFQFINERNSNFELMLNWTKLRENHETAVIERFQKYAKVLFQHKTLGIFSEKFRKFLKEKKLSKLYFAGIFTDVAVSKALMDSFDLGYEPFLLEDCSFTMHGSERHNGAVESLKRIIGKDRVMASSSI